jgi:hypothetical protein
MGFGWANGGQVWGTWADKGTSMPFFIDPTHAQRLPLLASSAMANQLVARRLWPARALDVVGVSFAQK